MVSCPNYEGARFLLVAAYCHFPTPAFCHSCHFFHFPHFFHCHEVACHFFLYPYLASKMGAVRLSTGT